MNGYEELFLEKTHTDATLAVAELLELFQLYCPSRTLKGSNTLKLE
jgi:hypothetical protein